MKIKNIAKPLRCARALFYILILMVSSPLKAQTQKPWQWAKQIGGEGWDMVNGIARDSKDNIYVAGGYFASLKGYGDKAKSLGSQDIFIACFDQDGNIKNVWSGGGTGGDQVSCLTVSSSDMLIAGGTVNDTISLGRLKDIAPGKRLFISSMTTRGNFSWITTIPVDGTASLTAVATDKQGNIYAFGSFSGKLVSGTHKIKSAGKNDLFLARLTFTGELTKLISFGGEEDELPGDFAVSDSGMIACSGQCGKTFLLGSHTVKGDYAKPVANAFIVRFNTSLSPEWVRNFSGKEYCNLSTLAFDKNINLYAGGNFNFSIHTGDTSFTSKGYSDIFIMKYSPQGKMLWGKSAGSWYYDYAFQVIPDNIQGAIITGALGANLQVDSLEIIPESQENSALVLQFDSTGKVTWGDCLSGSGRNFSSGAILDSKGNLYMTGLFHNTFKKNGEEKIAYGDQDIFLAKYHNCLETQAEITGSSWLCQGSYTTLKVKNDYSKVVWNDSIHDVNAIDIQSPGIVRVQMYDKRGCFLTDSVVVNLIPSPDIKLGNDTTLTSDSLLLKTQPGFIQYLWNNVAGTDTYVATSRNGIPGTYPFWVSATDSLGCVWSDTIQVTFRNESEYVDTNLDKAKMVSYPNPATDVVYWYLEVDTPCKISVELTDEHGRTFQQEYLENYMPGEIRKIDLNNLSKGLYNIRIKSQGTNAVKTLRIIKQ